eukprot:4194491-Amphidinium_carterae.2
MVHTPTSEELNAMLGRVDHQRGVVTLRSTITNLVQQFRTTVVASPCHAIDRPHTGIGGGCVPA